MNEIEQHGY